MARGKQLTWSELRVGLFVLVGLLVLAVAIFYVTGAGVFGPKYHLRTFLPEVSGLATGASWVCYFRALKIGDASKVAPVDKLSLVLVAVFAFVFLHERPSAREWLGILMVACGVFVLALRR